MFPTCRFEPVHPTGMLEGDDLSEAADGFKAVVKMEQEKGEW